MRCKNIHRDFDLTKHDFHGNRISERIGEKIVKSHMKSIIVYPFFLTSLLNFFLCGNFHYIRVTTYFLVSSIVKGMENVSGSSGMSNFYTELTMIAT